MRIFLFVFLFSSKLFSQVAISYYPFQSVLSVSSDTEKLFYADIGIFTNTFISDINLEGSTLINFRRREVVNYFGGLGFNFNPFNDPSGLSFTNGYSIKAGCRIKPFSRNRNVQLVFELSPYVNRYFDGGLLRTMLGISYNFNRSNRARE